MKQGSWKGTPLTIGLGAALLVGAATVAIWAIRGSEVVGKTCEAKVKIHEDRDVDRSHPDLPKRYVTRQELGKKVHKIDRRLDRMETIQHTILREVRNTRRRRTRPRRIP